MADVKELEKVKTRIIIIISLPTLSMAGLNKS